MAQSAVLERPAADVLSASDEAGSVVAGVRLSPDALDFCMENKLSDWLRVFADILRRQFTLRGPLEAERVSSCDEDDVFLAIQCPVAGSFDEIQLAYDRYVEACGRSIPWPESDLFALHLIYPETDGSP